MSRKALDLSGKRFGRLVAIEPTKERVNTSVIWKCVCDCGNTKKVISSDLIRGLTRSCGCLLKEKSVGNLRGIPREKINVALGLHDGTMESRLIDRPTKANKTGVRGVSFLTQKGKYKASITFKRKYHHLGYFDTLEEAKFARKEAERKIWGKDLE